MDTCLKNDPHVNPALSAKKIVVAGHVQGVGFRPFIYRIAVANNLTGWVKNCVGLVEIHVQGAALDIESFLSDLIEKKPPIAKPEIKSGIPADVGDYNDFSILESDNKGEANVRVPSDLFLCDDCLAELNNPSDRRYRYPFINCTQCGPRYTLIKALPYDRVNTTMASFELCAKCQAEYENPADRRFHAEPVACPECGPELYFHHGDAHVEGNESAIEPAVSLLLDGKVVAVKGIGGYHLMCDALNKEAVSLLRQNKPRPDKPLAVMFPAPMDDPFGVAENYVTLTEQDKVFLLQPSRPVLLVSKLRGSALSDLIAPGLKEIGMMLPYSPLHHLLLNKCNHPLVATSANISGEPVLINNDEVEKRLGHVADACLHHNRPIQRPADDPVYRTIAGKARPIRIGRGVAPLEIELPFELDSTVLAVGTHMKNVIVLAWKDRAVISPHIGEMTSSFSLEVFENCINDLQRLYNVHVQEIVCDAHPGYTTTRWAGKQGLPLHRVYHHHAHASSAYFECETDKSVISFAWDGVGYGEDKTLWGGEAFVGKPGQWCRVATQRPFYLPGGDKAGREPWRSAAALCWETERLYDDMPVTDPLLKQAWSKRINTPQTTSVGRLFDAAAALTGLCVEASFEGQGPMEFEALSEHVDNFVELPLDQENDMLIVNWAPLIPVMQDSVLSIGERSGIFHASLANNILQQAKRIRDKYDVSIVSFSGGVFQNRILTEQAIKLLSDNGFDVFVPELIPVNDAGISFGQIIEYGYKI